MTYPFRSAALLVLLAAQAAIAQDVPVAELPLDPATLAISGAWQYSTSNHKVEGDCPLGPAMSGTMVIDVRGTTAGVMIASGAVCNPATMCLFMGDMTDEELLVSNTATVDEEGGSATNTMVLFFTSDSAGAGRSSSRYVHPKGFECAWSNNVTLWRSED